MIIPTNYTWSAVLRPWSDWSPWSLPPGTSRQPPCTPCRSWRPDQARTRCGSTRWAPPQSCGWLRGSRDCCRWRRRRCKSRGQRSAGKWFWSYGTPQSWCVFDPELSRLIKKKNKWLIHNIKQRTCLINSVRIQKFTKNATENISFKVDITSNSGLFLTFRRSITQRNLCHIKITCSIRSRITDCSPKIK